MKDFLGQELKVGDKIIIADSHGRNAGASLVKAKVTGFTPQMVKFKKSYNGKPIKEESRCYPEKVAKLDSK